MTKRGPYAKTSGKRQQIIDAALALYAEAGSRRVSVRDIAQRVGMTDAGVLHHFGSREALLTAVLEARDTAAAVPVTALGDTADDHVKTLRDNTATPGLVKLFVDLAAAAAEPDHPAHDFFTSRYDRYRHDLAGLLDQDSETRPGTAPPAIDAEWAARILIAAVDGLQLQWLLEPDIDMAADITKLGQLLIHALHDQRHTEAASSPLGHLATLMTMYAGAQGARNADEPDTRTTQ
jgi:AcrR family transcriptional regulator